jgi:hypothetical protein
VVLCCAVLCCAEHSHLDTSHISHISYLIPHTSHLTPSHLHAFTPSHLRPHTSHFSPAYSDLTPHLHLRSPSTIDHRPSAIESTPSHPIPSHPIPSHPVHGSPRLNSELRLHPQATLPMTTREHHSLLRPTSNPPSARSHPPNTARGLVQNQNQKSRLLRPDSLLSRPQLADAHSRPPFNVVLNRKLPTRQRYTSPRRRIRAHHRHSCSVAFCTSRESGWRDRVLVNTDSRTHSGR